MEELKTAFTTDPILALVEPGRPAMLETDASADVIAAVASQLYDVNGKKVWKPFGYFSKKMTPAERNYDIPDQELLAIVRAFEEYRPELTASDPSTPILVLTDHKNLEYFMTKQRLNARQARWAETFDESDFRISYWPGSSNLRGDALSRRPQDSPSEQTLADRGRVLIDPSVVMSATEINSGQAATIDSSHTGATSDDAPPATEPDPSDTSTPPPFTADAGYASAARAVERGAKETPRGSIDPYLRKAQIYPRRCKVDQRRTIWAMSGAVMRHGCGCMSMADVLDPTHATA